jgi:hypothetical protein
MKWAKDIPSLAAKEAVDVIGSTEFKKLVISSFKDCAKEKKLQGFLQCKDMTNLHIEYQPPGYQEDWVSGVMCDNGHKESLLTATFKARRTQLDQYFGTKVFSKIYPDRPKDHILP